MKSNLRYFLIALAVVVAAAALYLSLRDAPASAPETAEAEQADQTLDAPAAAGSPYLTLSDINGNTVAMDPEKLTFINVWATWCGPCNAEMPSIEALYERYKDHPKMEFYVVSDEDPATVQNFLQRKDYQLPFYLMSGPYPAPLSGSAIPRTYMLRNGEVLAEQVGAVNWNDPQVFEFIDRQLAM